MEPLPTEPFKYRAFISYSHQDRVWGDWLHRKLETYRPPRKLGRKDGRELPRRIFPVFRDREELPTSADLGEVINQALKDSEYLIVICSPSSAKSIWVNEEIKHFKAMGREDKVLALIVDGEPNGSDKPGMEEQECFPKAMRFRVGADGEYVEERTEAVAGDARDEGDGRKNAFLKLVAGLLGVEYSALNDREQKRRTRRMLSLGTAAALLLVLMAGIWAVQERRRAEDLALEQERTAAALTDSEHNLAVARDNLGLAYYRQAMVEHEANNFNDARIFAANSLLNLDHGEHGSYFSDLLGILVSSPLYLPARIMGEWNQGMIRAAAVSEEAGIMALRTEAGELLVWDMETRQVLGRTTLDSAAGSVALSDDGRLAAVSLGYDGVQVLDVETLEPVTRIPETGGAVSELAFSPDGTSLALGTCGERDNGRVLVADVETGEVVAEFGDHRGCVDSLAFSADGSMLASSDTWQSEVLEYEVPDSEDYSGPIHEVHSMGLIHRYTGDKLISVSRVVWNMYLWDTQNHELVRTISSRSGSISGASFSPDGSTVAGGTVGGEVSVWDLADGSIRWTGDLGDDRVRDVHVRHMGPDRLLAYGPEGVIQVWDADSGQELASASAGLGRVLQAVALENGRDVCAVSQYGLRELALDSDARLWSAAAVGQGPVNAVAASPDCELVASQSADGVRVWNATSGELVSMTLGQNNNSRLSSLSFSSQGTLLAVFGNSGVRLLDSLSGETVDQGEKTGLFRATALTRQGDRWAWISMNDASVVRVQATATRGMLQTFSIQGVERLEHVCFSRNGSELAVAAFSDVYVLDAQTGEVLQTFTEHMDAIQGLAFDRGGVMIAAHNESSIRIWNSRTGAIAATLSGSYSGIQDVRFLDDVGEPYSSILAFLDDQGVIHFWDYRNEVMVSALESHNGAITCFAVSPDSSVIWTGLDNGNLVGWDISSFFTHAVSERGVFSGVSMAFAPDSGSYVTGSSGGVFRMYFSGSESERLVETDAVVNDVALSDDGRYLAYGADSVQALQVDDGQVVYESELMDEDVHCVGFVPQSHRLAMTLPGTGLRLYDLDAGETVWELGLDTWRFVMAPSGSMLAVAHRSGERDFGVSIVDAASGLVLGDIPFQSRGPRDMDFVPGETLLACVGWWDGASLYDIQTQEMVEEIDPVPGDRVVSLAFSPDGRMLASGHSSGRVLVFDWASRELLATFKAHDEEVESLWFSPSGNMLASASVRYVRIWDLAPLMDGYSFVGAVESLRDQLGLEVQGIEIVPAGEGG